ncbi:MAG: nuclear transport factor 2 family protein [Bacteroidota bacterium]
MNPRSLLQTKHASRTSHALSLWRILGLGLFVGLSASPTLAQDAPADSAAIRATATDYLLGFYTGDEARMERALHTDLAKRIVRPAETGPPRVDQMSAMRLVQIARSGAGTRIPEDARIMEIEILDIDGDNASIKTVATGFFDYMHLARFPNGWKIVNVLWDVIPPTEAD